jgi:hypothetical protein
MHACKTEGQAGSTKSACHVGHMTKWPHMLYSTLLHLQRNVAPLSCFISLNPTLQLSAYISRVQISTSVSGHVSVIVLFHGLLSPQRIHPTARGRPLFNVRSRSFLAGDPTQAHPPTSSLNRTACGCPPVLSLGLLSSPSLPPSPRTGPAPLNPSQ